MKIPKKIHYVWLGDKPMGVLENKCLESWKKIFPDYEIIKWGNECIEKFDNPYFQQAIKAKKYAFASDYVRLQAMLEHGGIYFDTDEEALRPLDEFMEHDFFIGCQKCGTAREISPALFGAVPNSPIIKDLLAIYDKLEFITPNGYNQKTNPVYFMQVLGEKYDVKEFFISKGRVKITDNAYLYPYTYFCTKNENAYAIHHYAGSWMPSWKIKDRFSLKFSKAKYVFRKYKMHREDDLIFSSDEKLVFWLKTSQRSAFAIVRIYNNVS